MSFFRNNKKLILAFISGLVLLVLYFVLYYNSEVDVSPFIRLLLYVSVLLILFSLYIFSVRKRSLIFSNIILIFCLIFTVETILFFVLGMPSVKRKYFSYLDLPENHISVQLGSVYEPDSIYHSELKENNQVVFDVNYSIDHNRKRITPDHDSTRKEYALFFGCSIAFGHGVQDNQTFPYYFQEISGKYNAYNFAVSGTGTNHVLAKLQYEDLSKQVEEKSGIAFYVFFWDHIFRAIGSMHRYTDWLTYAPYYHFNDQKLVRDKLFVDGRFITSRFYELVHQSNIVKYFEIDFPLSLSDKHFDVVTEMIREAKNEYADQFGNDNFYVVLYPAYPAYTIEEMNRLKYFLDKKQLKYFDLNEVLTYAHQYTLGGDPHPNAKTHEYLAGVLFNDINSLQKSKNN